MARQKMSETIEALKAEIAQMRVENEAMHCFMGEWKTLATGSVRRGATTIRIAARASGAYYRVAWPGAVSYYEDGSIREARESAMSLAMTGCSQDRQAFLDRAAAIDEAIRWTDAAYKAA